MSDPIDYGTGRRIEENLNIVVARLSRIVDILQQLSTELRHNKSKTKIGTQPKELSARVLSAMSKAGFLYWDDLIGMDPKDVLRRAKLGKKSLVELQAAAKSVYVNIPTSGFVTKRRLWWEGL